MIVIDQGGEWLWQKVQNIPNSLKRMRYSISDLSILWTAIFKETQCL